MDLMALPRGSGSSNEVLPRDPRALVLGRGVAVGDDLGDFPLPVVRHRQRPPVPGQDQGAAHAGQVAVRRVQEAGVGDGSWEREIKQLNSGGLQFVTGIVCSPHSAGWPEETSGMGMGGLPGKSSERYAV